LLIVVQFAFADLRMFQPHQAGRLLRPNWTRPTHVDTGRGEEFLRGLGKVLDRKRHASLAEQTRLRTDRAERYYADVSSSIFTKYFQIHVGSYQVRIHPAFTRVISDGQIAVRLEFGFRVSVEPSFLYSETRIDELLTHIMKTTVFRRRRVERQDKKDARKRIKIHRLYQDKQLGDYSFKLLYTQCTTNRTDKHDPLRSAKHVFPSGVHAIVILPASSAYRWLGSARLEYPKEAGFDLAHADKALNSRWSLDVWYLGNYGPESIARIRSLRLHVLRLSGELNALIRARVWLEKEEVFGQFDRDTRLRLRESIQRSLDRLSDTAQEVAGSLNLDRTIRPALEGVMPDEVTKLRAFVDRLRDHSRTSDNIMDEKLKHVGLTIKVSGDAHFGDRDMSTKIGGDYTGGDKTGGDKTGGDKVDGDKIDRVTTSNSQGVAIGRKAKSSVSQSSNSTTDSEALSNALTALAKHVRDQTGKEDAEVEATLIDAAAVKAQAGDAGSAAAILKKSAGWVLDLAKSAGASVLVAFLKSQLGVG
jgi:hypothetical protein